MLQNDGRVKPKYELNTKNSSYKLKRINKLQAALYHTLELLIEKKGNYSRNYQVHVCCHAARKITFRVSLWKWFPWPLERTPKIEAHVRKQAGCSLAWFLPSPWPNNAHPHINTAYTSSPTRAHPPFYLWRERVCHFNKQKGEIMMCCHWGLFFASGVSSAGCRAPTQRDLMLFSANNDKTIRVQQSAGNNRSGRSTRSADRRVVFCEIKQLLG